MPRLFPSSATLAVVLAATLAGCASLPGPAGSGALSPMPEGCDAIAGEIARTEQARRVAIEQADGAWKAVIPFAVAGRYATGKAAAGEAGQRMAELQRERARQGCADGAG